MTSVVTRTRGILRRCTPQDDNYFVILSGTTWSEESRACAVQQPPPGWQRPSRRSEQGGRDGRALRAPTGWHFAPSCCFGKWVASARRDNAFTREARPEGKRGDSQEGRNRRCLPSCAPAARSGYVPAARRRRNPLPVGSRHRRCAVDGEYPRRTSQVQPFTRTSPSAPDGAATSPQRGGRIGGAGRVGGIAQARDSSLRAAPSAQNGRGN